MRKQAWTRTGPTAAHVTNFCQAQCFHETLTPRALLISSFREELDFPITVPNQVIWTNCFLVQEPVSSNLALSSQVLLFCLIARHLSQWGQSRYFWETMSFFIIGIVLGEG